MINFQTVVNLYLCPFCDQPLGPRKLEWFQNLPHTEDTKLPTLLNQMWNVSDENPSPSNRHRRIPRTGSADLKRRTCGQRRYEVGCLPMAVQFKWPTSIDYAAMVNRLSQPTVLAKVFQLYEKPWESILLTEPPNARRSYFELENKFHKDKSALGSAG